MLVAVVVIGPRNLPVTMQKLGRGIAKLKRVATDIRSQSGIDEVLRAEGIENEIRELHKLATGRLLDLNLDAPPVDLEHRPLLRNLPARSREYPLGGVDAADALPEDAHAYAPAAPQIVPSIGAVARGKGGFDDDDEPEAP